MFQGGRGAPQVREFFRNILQFDHQNNNFLIDFGLRRGTPKRSLGRVATVIQNEDEVD